MIPKKGYGVSRVKEYISEGLDKEISIFEEVYFESDANKIDFQKGEKELKKHWELIIKKRFIEDLYLIENIKPNLNPKAQKALALKKTSTFFKDYIDQISEQSSSQLLEKYANAYLTNIDYQSAFLSPESKAEWDAKFDRSMVGVGINFETTLTYPKINNVLFDGPAWKTKRIKAGDFLMKISTEENILIDVAGFSSNKIIDLLKGKEGSVVNVVIKNAAHKTEEVAITRGQVSLSQAMSFVLKEKSSSKKIGYIYLPRFYRGEEGCASHVLKELQKLKEKNVEAIIFDLRNNQGGSSAEAIKIIAYFLKGGTVMQTKYADGNHRTFEDDDETVQYSGDLMVLVNERSGSASELLAGTLQDYNRALVVGNQTFGKGTVQRFFDVMDEKGVEKFGAVKLSIASFYTGLGRSTQYHGISPDFILPNKRMYTKTGERAVKNALKFEDIDTLKTETNINQEQVLQKMQLLSKTRLLNNDYFVQLQQAAILERDKKSTISLNYKTYKSKKDQLKENNLKPKPIENFVVLDLSPDEYEKGKTKHWKNKLERDQSVYESYLIMNDYLRLKK